MLDVEDFQRQLDTSPGKKGTMQLPEVGHITLEEVEVQMIKRLWSFIRIRYQKLAISLGLTRSASLPSIG